MADAQRMKVILRRSIPAGMHTADGKAGIGMSFGTDMEGYQIIISLAPQGSAAMSGQVRSSCAARGADFLFSAFFSSPFAAGTLYPSFDCCRLPFAPSYTRPSVLGNR